MTENVNNLSDYIDETMESKYESSSIFKGTKLLEDAYHIKKNALQHC